MYHFFGFFQPPINLKGTLPANGLGFFLCFTASEDLRSKMVMTWEDSLFEWLSLECLKVLIMIVIHVELFFVLIFYCIFKNNAYKTTYNKKH